MAVNGCSGGGSQASAGNSGTLGSFGGSAAGVGGGEAAGGCAWPQPTAGSTASDNSSEVDSSVVVFMEDRNRRRGQDASPAVSGACARALPVQVSGGI
ncbi:hypothetical protein SM139_2329 [Stenotrophomonas maltophilia]|nr:hypothetical protein SM139_2329 [Stenotrophomonas maltophilia]